MSEANGAEGESARTTETKHALIIGIDHYPLLKNHSLRGCVNDAVAVYDFCLQSLSVPTAKIVLLLAPSPANSIRPDLGEPLRATRQAILDAFTTLAQRAKSGDEVVIYYAGHGVRIGFNPQPKPGDEHPFQPNKADPYENLTALVPDDVSLDGSNLLLGPELRACVQQVVKPGVRVTVLLDCCHSTGAARGDLEVTVRGIELGPFDREKFVTDHPLDPLQNLAATPADTKSGTRGLAEGESGWPLDLVDLVTVAACQYDQKSHEYAVDDTAHHGAFTRFLLHMLTTADPAKVDNLTWENISTDLIKKVRNEVQQKAGEPQTPTFEGAVQRPIFSGVWRPYPPGITVTTSFAEAGQQITLSAGKMAGLEQNAEVAIFPPDSRSFAPADIKGIVPVKARIVKVTDTDSQAAVFDPPGAIVEEGSRALVTRPGTPPIKVAMLDVPEDLAAAIRSTPGADAFLNFTAPEAEAIIQVRRRTDIDGQEGWVLAQAPRSGAIVSADNVIAYAVYWDPEQTRVPPIPTGAALDTAKLGAMITAGLVQWARYHAILTRTHDVEALRDALSFSLRVAPNRQILINTPCSNESLTRAHGEDSPIVVQSTDWVLCKVKVTEHSPGPLHVAILACSDDGNVSVVWPPRHSQVTLVPTEEQCVGLGGRDKPFHLPPRPDQTRSAYTLKLFASDSEHPFDTGSLSLRDTVQQMINGEFMKSRGLEATEATPRGNLTAEEVDEVPQASVLTQGWTVRDLKVLVTHARAR